MCDRAIGNATSDCITPVAASALCAVSGSSCAEIVGDRAILSCTRTCPGGIAETVHQNVSSNEFYVGCGIDLDAVGVCRHLSDSAIGVYLKAIHVEYGKSRRVIDCHRRAANNQVCSLVSSDIRRVNRNRRCNDDGCLSEGVSCRIETEEQQDQQSGDKEGRVGSHSVVIL